MAFESLDIPVEVEAEPDRDFQTGQLQITADRIDGVANRLGLDNLVVTLARGAIATAAPS
jgi:hypothetical protein